MMTRSKRFVEAEDEDSVVMPKLIGHIAALFGLLWNLVCNLCTRTQLTCKRL